MLNAINSVRAQHGLAPLTANAQLQQAAQGHAVDMSTHPGMVHIGSDGSNGGQRIRAAGYQWKQWGEIVAWGWQGNVDRAVEWWLNSPDHRPYLLSNQFVDAGIGYAYEPASPWQHYWVVDFGRNGSATPPPPPPRPDHVVHVPVVVGGKVAPGLDLLPYLRGDGRAYRVGNSRGSFEVFQTQTEGDRFYQIKAWDNLEVVNWEGFLVDDSYIRRDVDTSPGDGRFYRQFDAPWVARRMSVGQSFTQSKHVQFYRLADCRPLESYSGDVTDVIQLVDLHARFTFPARDWPAVTLEDVVQLRWTAGEDYFYARGYGLVAWGRTHQDINSPAWSAISEMRPNVGRLPRLRVDCL